MIEHFARSAANAAAGGFDGIEVHGAHGYLIHEFLSPKSNHRTDEYGGSLENRMRFGVEVLAAVRAAVGPAVAVGLRLVGDEEQGAGGLTADDAAEIAARFEALDLVDFLNVSVGTSGVGMVRPLYAPHLLGVYASAAVKKRVSRTPVFAVHRILTPDEAEGILERERGRRRHRRACVHRRRVVGREGPHRAERRDPQVHRQQPGLLREPHQRHADHVREQPGGRARRHARRGHAHARRRAQARRRDRRRARRPRGGVGGGRPRATRSPCSSGRPSSAARSASPRRLPGREELSDFADWRIAECDRRGVDVRVGTEATADSVLALEPDAVVVATGGKATKFGYTKWHPMPIPGAEQDFVIDHIAALRDPDAIGERVVILDAVGHIEAIGLGELLATMGRDVTTVTTLPTPMLLDAETMMAALPRACRAGMRWRPNTAMAAIGDHEVQLVDALSIQFDTVPADTVVIRTHGLPEEGLYHELRDRVPQVLRIGDAIAVRLADRAIFDGHLAGRAI